MAPSGSVCGLGAWLSVGTLVECGVSSWLSSGAWWVMMVLVRVESGSVVRMDLVNVDWGPVCAWVWEAASLASEE